LLHRLPFALDKLLVVIRDYVFALTPSASRGWFPEPAGRFFQQIRNGELMTVLAVTGKAAKPGMTVDSAADRKMLGMKTAFTSSRYCSTHD
jgi:hypothetical protein